MDLAYHRQTVRSGHLCQGGPAQQKNLRVMGQAGLLLARAGRRVERVEPWAQMDLALAPQLCRQAALERPQDRGQEPVAAQP
jgi:hypothetical protein